MPETVSDERRGGAASGARALVSRLARDRALRAAAFAFVLTRLLVLAVFILAARFEVVLVEPGRSDYAGGALTLNRAPVARTLRYLVSRADCNWYVSIAVRGYEHRPFSAERQTNWAFFPLFPLTLRYASRLTGDPQLTGIALSHVFLFVALWLLYRTARLFDLTDADAARAVFYLAAYPVSYFFSVPMTESLFLLLTVLSFHEAKSRRWLTAGLAGALASATRSTGVLLLPALALVYWETYRTLKPRLNFLPLLLVPAGLVSFMLFLRRTTGDALAFKDILVAWGRTPRFFLAPLWDFASDPLLLAKSWDFRVVNFLAAVLALACGFVLLRRRAWSLACYTLSATFVALSSGLLQSQARYALLLFPAFFVLATWGRSPRADQIIRTISLILLTLMSLLFARNIDVALS
ncbi:MAG: glycosyltransferase family 39 protein [Acidobacteria bacterium]|nr:glycosyltransferase family 39 protein [Acidobacteriota bacterium]